MTNSYFIQNSVAKITCGFHVKSRTLQIKPRATATPRAQLVACFRFQISIALRCQLKFYWAKIRNLAAFFWPFCYLWRIGDWLVGGSVLAALTGSCKCCCGTTTTTPHTHKVRIVSRPTANGTVQLHGPRRIW